jgi:hypothetical protein
MRKRSFTTANATFMKSMSSAPDVTRMAADMNRLVSEFSEKMIADHGAPATSETAMGNRMAVSRVVAIESRDIPDSMFELPTDYQLKVGMPGQD